MTESLFKPQPSVQQQVKECLDLMQREKERKLGCTAVILLTLLAGGLLYLAGMELEMLPPTAIVLMFLMFAILSEWEDRRKMRSIGRSVECFEQRFPHDEAGRQSAYNELRRMASEQKHSYQASAKQLMIELGVPAEPPMHSAEKALTEAVERLPSAREDYPEKPQSQETAASPPTSEQAPAPKREDASGYVSIRGTSFIPLEPEKEK